MHVSTMLDGDSEWMAHLLDRGGALGLNSGELRDGVGHHHRGGGGCGGFLLPPLRETSVL